MARSTGRARGTSPCPAAIARAAALMVNPGFRSLLVTYVTQVFKGFQTSGMELSQSGVSLRTRGKALSGFSEALFFLYFLPFLGLFFVFEFWFTFVYAFMLCMMPILTSREFQITHKTAMKIRNGG